MGRWLGGFVGVGFRVANAVIHLLAWKVEMVTAGDKHLRPLLPGSDLGDFSFGGGVDVYYIVGKAGAGSDAVGPALSGVFVALEALGGGSDVAVEDWGCGVCG